MDELVLPDPPDKRMLSVFPSSQDIRTDFAFPPVTFKVIGPDLARDRDPELELDPEEALEPELVEPELVEPELVEPEEREPVEPELDAPDRRPRRLERLDEPSDGPFKFERS
jgi:hypothetical protein